MDALSQTDRDTKRIAELNDRLRNLFLGGQVLLTSSVAALEEGKREKVLQAVKAFSAFNEGNDPHKERDMCIVEVDGEQYWAKVDYFDLDMRYLSDDPSDETVTRRVMTIGHQSEW